MATFGKTDIGATNYNIADGFKSGFKFTSPADAGTLTKLTLYCDGLGAGVGAEVLKGLVYADSAGVPGSRLGIGNEITIADGQAAAWVDLTFGSTIALSPNTVYHLGYIGGPVNNAATTRYDALAGGHNYNANSYAAGATDPFGAATTEAITVSIYATYTPVGTTYTPALGIMEMRGEIIAEWTEPGGVGSRRLRLSIGIGL